ncbi:GNAT family N-acetyltransferase [Duganella sp. CY15W]|uniref:GNAT family N-acetyltransferase n=1 Tax=Duganella sp. CY15W TaxID=2692172 RepID=UPI00137209EA|nr:GNAT family N-acetyltransferase [Duganella sp. CY15W]MYM28035.1 GNAT family N-acetyltransferase [Duganella sp. CY15W]
MIELQAASHAEERSKPVLNQHNAQDRALWLPQVQRVFPLSFEISGEHRHPARPAQPVGVVYQRHIPWLQQTLSFRVADIDAHLPHFHRWMNDPFVAEFWEEEGSLDYHRSYLERLGADPHSIPLIACLDERPIGYFEVYWAKEDRISPFCDATDFDRGWHVLIGEADCRGKAFVSAWLPSISHYLFLDDHRTHRLVIEPRSDNQRMRRNLQRSGYSLLGEFDFPHKRAVLGALPRQRFFDEQFWSPR